MDHPATQRAKRRGLDERFKQELGNLQFVEIDLINEASPAHHFDNTPTVFMIEGVLMYIPESKVIDLLDSLRASPIDRLAVIFSFMTQWPDGGSGFMPRSRLIELWRAWSKEPFAWALEPALMSDFLSSRGFKLEEIVLCRDLAGSQTKLDGENIVFCTKQGPADDSASP